MDKQNSGNIQTPFFHLNLHEHPLAEPTQHLVAVGSSVSDILDKAPKSGGNTPAVLVNGGEVEVSYIPQEDDVVSVTFIPGTGLEWYWVVAIIVGSAALSYALMPDIGSQQEGQDRNVFDRISGISNKSPLYEPFQAVLGKRKVAPVYISRPYTTIEGGREYFHALFSAGYGPLKLENFRIGETAIADFDDVEIVVLDHYENTDESVIREFWQQDIAQESVQIELREEEGWTNRTTQVNGDYIVSNFLFPQGVFSYDGDGNLDKASVHIRQDFQSEAGDWYTPILHRRSFGNNIRTLMGTVTEINGTMYLWNTTGEKVDVTNSYQVSANSVVFTYDYIDTRTGTENTDDNYILGKNVPELVLLTSVRKYSDNPQPQFASLRLALDDNLWPTGAAIPTRARKEYPSQDEATDEKITGAVTWENIQTIRPLTDAGFKQAIGYSRPDTYLDGTPIRTFRPTVIGIRMRATGQLNGNLDNFFVDATMCVPNDRTADWRDWPNLPLVESTNPADAYKWLMQGPVNYRPISNDKINHTLLSNWRNRCTSEGWNISALVDYESTLFQELQNVAYVGRAEFGFRDGQFGVVEKIARTVPKQIFTPKNSANFQSKRVYPEVVDGIKFTFESEVVDYERDEGIFLDPAKNPDNNGGSTSKLRGRYRGVDLWGVDNYDQGYRLVRFDYYEQFLQRELYTLDVDIEVLASQRGDLVRVQNDIINVGIGAGRIKDITGDIVTIDETIDTDNLPTQTGLQFRNSQGVVLTTQATYLGDGQWDCVTVDPSLQVGDLTIYGELGKEAIDCIIRSIVYNADMGATLTLVNSANEIYSYDGDPIPTYNPNVTLPVDLTQPPTPVIAANSSNGALSVVVSNPNLTLPNTYRAFIQVRSYPTGEDPVDFFDNANSNWIYVAQGEVAQSAFTILGQPRGLTYQVRVHYRSSGGMVSAWSNVEEVTLPLSVNLPPVENFTYSHLTDGTYLLYTPVTDVEFDSYEIRTDTNFGVKDSAYVGTTKDNLFFLGLLSAGDTYYIAAKNIYGAYGPSSNVSIANNTPQDPANFNAVNEGFGSRLSWEKVETGYAIDFFEINYTEAGIGDVFGSSQFLASVDALTATHSTSDRGVYWYYIRAVDIAGNASGWVSTFVDVELSSSYITEQLAQVDTHLDEIDTSLNDYDFDISEITRRAEDSELEILQSLAQQSASREELRSRITEGEVLIDAAVYIDPNTGTIINRAFLYSDELFNQASLAIDGVNASISANVESISLLEDEVSDISAELLLVPGQITSTAQTIVAEAISALEPAHSFNFFDSAQNWFAINGTLSATTPNQIDLTWGDIQNDNLSFDATENTVIRITVERTGGTGWNGDVTIVRDNASTYTFSGIIEDIPSGGEIVRNIDFRGLGDWSGTIESIRLNMGASVSDTFTVKAIVIGKPDAALLELDDLTSRVTIAEQNISSNDGRITSVVTDLQTFSDETDDNFVLVSQDINAVDAKIENRVFEIVGNRRDFEDDALEALFNEIDNSNYRIADLTKTLNFADAINLLQVEVSEEGALARSLAALEATTVSQGTAIQANTELLQEVETDIEGNSSAITRIASGVTGESNESTALLTLDAYLGQGGLGARAFLGTDVNDRVTGIIVNDSGTEQQIEFFSNSVAFVDGNGATRIYYDLVNQRYVFDGEIQASAGSFTGNIEADSGDIANWIIEPNYLASAASGQRIELDSSKSRITVFDAVNDKVVMGYLDGLPKNDGSGNWASNDYGFWARSGDNLVIDGAVDYTSGDFAVQNDASVSIYDSSANEIVRLGTDNGSKGMFVYNTSGTRIVELSTGGMLIGDLGGQFIRWTAGGGLDVSGDIESSGGTIGGWTITGTTLQNGTTTINSANSTISLGTNVSIAPNAISIGDGFSWDTANGLVVDSDAEIAGWDIQSNLLRSKTSGSRIELNATNNRVSVFDSVNEKVAMGYLNGLPKFDGSGNWTSNDYGFWARQGDTLVIDGSVDYNNGDFIVQNDASIKIRDGATANEILRLGTDAGEKGLFIYDASTPDGSAANLLSKFTSDEIFVGSANNYVSWDSVSGLEVSGKITVGTTVAGQDIGEIRTNANTALSNANAAQDDADAANELLSDIASDNKLTPSEKQSTQLEMDKINDEYSRILTQANDFGVSASDYTNKYNGINNYTSGLLSDLTTTSTIVGTTFRNNFAMYYDARQVVLNAISDAAKASGDDAQSNLDTLIGNLGDVAYEDLIEVSKLGTTVIDGGYIKTNLINADVVLANTAVFNGSGDYTGNVIGDIGGTAASTVRDNASDALSAANTANTNLTTLTNNLGEVAYQDLLSQAYLDRDLITALGNLTPNGSTPNGTVNDLVSYSSGIVIAAKSSSSGLSILQNAPTEYTIRFPDDGQYRPAKYAENLVCTGGEKYAVKFHFAVESGNTQTVQVRIDFEDIDGNVTQVVDYATQSNNTWTQYDYILSAPSDAVKINAIYLIRIVNNFTGGFSYVTGLEVKRVVTGQDILDGAIEKAKMGTTIIDGGVIAADLLSVGAIFAGSLNAATGTFTGDLTAAGGTFTGTLNGVDGSFTGTVSGGVIDGGLIQTIGSNAMIVRRATPFGPDNLIEWYGPTAGNVSGGSAILNNLTKQNGVHWMDAAGEKSRDIERKATTVPSTITSADTSTNTWHTLATLDHLSVGGVAELSFGTGFFTGTFRTTINSLSGVIMMRVIDQENTVLWEHETDVTMTGGSGMGTVEDLEISTLPNQDAFLLSDLVDNTAKTKYVNQDYRLQIQFNVIGSYESFTLNTYDTRLFSSLEVTQ